MLAVGVGHRTKPQGVVDMHCHSSPEEGTSNVIKQKTVMRRCPAMVINLMQRIEKKRKGYAFQRQFNEKPSTIPGCPVSHANI